MKIGIDIDNCISNFDDVLLKEYLKHDKELRNTGIINENPEYLRKCILHTHSVFYKLYKIIIYVQNINFKNVSKNIH